MPQRYGISFFRPEVRSAVATGTQARGAVAIGALAVAELEIGRLQVRDRVDGDA